MRRTACAALLTFTLAGTLAGGGDGAATAASGDAVLVGAGDTSCTVSTAELPAGSHVFHIENTGSQVTEVYLYDDGNRIVAEKEDIGPGLSYELTAQISAGSYEVLCRPGMTGDGVRTRLTVTGAAGVDPAQARAVSQYRAFVQEQADALVPLVQGLAAAVTAGDVARAKALYAPSRVPWETIEPVAESFGDLDPAIDAREADLEPGQAWTGWHRIEKSLWAEGSTAGLAPVAAQLVKDVTELRERIGTAGLTVASIGNGAKELLDEVATGKITGEEEAFSHTDLVDVEANVAGAQKALDVLRPLVQDPGLLAQLDAAFAGVDTVLRPYRTPTGYVSYETVDAGGRRELARVADALGEPLSRLSAAATA